MPDNLVGTRRHRDKWFTTNAWTYFKENAKTCLIQGARLYNEYFCPIVDKQIIQLIIGHLATSRFVQS
jgi:hypothetical protein